MPPARLTTEAPAAVFLGIVAWAALINLQRGTLGQWLAAKFLNAGNIPAFGGRTSGLEGPGTTVTPAGDDFAIPNVVINPVPGSSVSSSFGAPRSGGRTHKGIDLFATRGTPVLAAQAGTVTRAGDGGELCGTRIAIDHGSNLDTLYCHLDGIAVRANTEVRQGQTIGYVGNTGNASTTSPHLHFEIHLRGRALDPAPFLR